MKPKTTIILVVAILIVAALVVLQRTDLLRSPEMQTPSEAQALKLWKIEPEEMTTFTITRVGGQSVHFIREASGWRIAEPIDAKARQYLVDQLIRTLQQPAIVRSYDPDDADAPGTDVTGLDQPQWLLRFNDEQGRDFSLHIGRPVPLSGGSQTYVQVPSLSQSASAEPVFVLATDFASQLSRSVSDYRDPLVLNLPAETVQRLVVEGRRRVDLIRGKQGWRLAPQDAPADIAGVNRLLNALARVSAEEFVPGEPASLAPFGLTPGNERLIAQIWTKPLPSPTTEPATEPADRQPDHTLALGSITGEQIYAQLDGGDVMLLPASILEALQADPNDLRNRQILTVTPADVRRIEIDSPEGSAELARREDGWRMTNPYSGPANAQAIGELLDALTTLTAESFRDEPGAAEALGLTDPQGRIVLHQAGVDAPLILRLGGQSPSGEMTFLAAEGAESVAVVKTAAVEAIVRGPAAYWPTLLLEVPSDVRITEIFRRNGPEVSLAMFEDVWRVALPADGPSDHADAKTVNRLLDQVERLQASRVVAIGSQVPVRYADAEGIEVRISGSRSPAATQPAEEEPAEVGEPFSATIRAAEVDGRAYAWVVGNLPVVVGEFSPVLLEDLKADLREKLILRFDPQQIQTIDVAAGETTFQLRRENETWVCPADLFVPIVVDKVADFLSELASLRADRFAELPEGDALALTGLEEPWLTLTLTGDAGQSHRLMISQIGPDARTRYAISDGVDGVLVIPSAIAARMAVTLESFSTDAP